MKEWQTNNWTLSFKAIERLHLPYKLRNRTITVNFTEMKYVVDILELATLDLILEKFQKDDDKLKIIQECAIDAFRIIRFLPLSNDAIQRNYQLLHIAAFAILSGHDIDATKILRQIQWYALSTGSSGTKHTWFIIPAMWLRLLQRIGKDDTGIILQRIDSLKKHQLECVKSFPGNIYSSHAKSPDALELTGLYHLAKATEIMAIKDNFLIRQILRRYFYEALFVCEQTRLTGFDLMTERLNTSAIQIVKNIKEKLKARSKNENYKDKHRTF